MNLQAWIDNAYPPTDTYDIGPPPMPTGVLAKRVLTHAETAGGFFYGDRLLDVGCSKGYFSFANESKFGEVVAIDSNPAAIGRCRDLAAHYGSRVYFEASSFRDFHAPRPFDRIFIGNGPHHMYREIGSHDWTAKLAALSCGLVLTEGPVDCACPDIAKEPNVYHANFAEFDKSMRRYFTLLSRRPAVQYTPGRVVSLWERKPMTVPDGIRVFHKHYKLDEYCQPDEVSVFVASTSPISNGLLAIDSTGWTEARFPQRPVPDDGRNERTVWRQLCRHQQYLARLGYTDLDTGVINFIPTAAGLRLFDKSAVVPISTLSPKQVEVYFTVLRKYGRWLFDRAELIQRIRAALESADAAEIERAFAWAESQH
jgi:predicted RNA methylase